MIIFVGLLALFEIVATVVGRPAIQAARPTRHSAAARGQEDNDLHDVLLGLVIPPRAVSAERARSQCLALPRNSSDVEVNGPHGETLISARCDVVEHGPVGGVASKWTMARYHWTSVFTAEDPARGAAARDTVVEEEVVLFEVRNRRLQAVWHARFERGDYAVLRSITPEIARRPDGTTLLSVMRCLNGTGGCGQQFLHRHLNGRWVAVKQTWLTQLPQTFRTRIRHGVLIESATLVATAGFYADTDPNCCPSEELIAQLTLRNDALLLVGQPTVRVP